MIYVIFRSCTPPHPSKKYQAMMREGMGMGMKRGHEQREWGRQLGAVRQSRKRFSEKKEKIF